MKNLQFLLNFLKKKKKKMIAPSSTEANDTYTCILFKLTSSLGDKDVI